MPTGSSSSTTTSTISSPEEIARLMRISLNTVYSRKNKIRQKLVELLERKKQPELA